MANLATNVPLVNEAFVDPQTGKITEAWFIFLIQLWRRTGGGGGTEPTSITLDDVFSIEQTFGYSAPAGVADFLSQLDTMVRPVISESALSGEATFGSPGPKDSLTDMIFAPLGGSAGSGSGNIADQMFVSGTGFTPGVTTSLTLANTFTNGAQVWVFFDGTFQGDDQYSLSGTTLTFTSAIPVGVGTVYVKGLR